MDPDDYPVVLMTEDGEVCEVECQHSMDGNLAEIRRIESESEGYWAIARTGHREIDSQYGYLDDDHRLTPAELAAIDNIFDEVTDPWKEEDQ
jgi:hypothetical protein